MLTLPNLLTLSRIVAIPLLVCVLVFADMLEPVSETPPVAQAA